MNKNTKSHAPPNLTKGEVVQALLSLCARLPFPAVCTLRLGAGNVRRDCICLP